MGLHQWSDGTSPHLLIPFDEEIASQPPPAPPEHNRPLPPWLDVNFLTRLDTLNGLPDSDTGRPTRTSSGIDESICESIAAFVHDVRTPLATIHATLELLNDGTPLDSDDLQQLVGRLQRGVTWITELVDGLSSWSETYDRAADGDIPVEMQPASVNVRGWIEQAIALVQPIAEGREQSILLACPRPAPVVSGDQFRLEQVMINLLTNACHYGAWGDTIAVSVIADHRFVTVRVSDHGVGILPEERNRIFERRVRGTQTGERHVNGQGLGLHIARGIVERHGGTIEVESTVGHGSTFSIRLPAVRAIRPLMLRRAACEESDVSE